MKKMQLQSEANFLQKKDYHKYQDVLRFDFYYACAYCSITEIEATGIGFEIDHYFPKEKFPSLKSDYSNLMWSCRICNRYKSDYHPDAEDLRNGYVILRIDKCDPRDHLELDHDAMLFKSKTTTGEFNIQRLELNRKQLRRLRQYRERFFNASNYIAFGIHDLISLDLDNIHPRYRLLFQKIKRYVMQREYEVTDSINFLIRDFAHSTLLDKDPTKKERQKRRKEYLKQHKAIVPLD